MELPHTALAAARDLGPAIVAAREGIELERRMPVELLAKLREAGMFRLQTPAEFGGYDLDHLAFMSVVEEVAKADGSAAWTVNVCNGGGLAGFLPPATAKGVFGQGCDVLVASSYNPSGGRAVRVEGGFRVSGTWKFVSGCHHADWFVFGCLVKDPDASGPPTGPPEIVRVLVRPEDAQILDTWHVAGLRGTGSHDVTVSGAFVPAEHVLSWRPTRPETVYRFPQTSLLGLGFASVALGIARSAIDALAELAGSKRPVASRSLLRERATVQVDMARAENLVRSSRAYLHETVASFWHNAEAGVTPTLQERALLRGAVVHASESAAQAVDLMYNAGGATSLFETCHLERCFRDIHALTQQITVASHNLETVGRVLLGLEADEVLI